MSNTTGQDRIAVTPWDAGRVSRLPSAIPAANFTMYGGQAIMRDGSGNLIQCDDTAKGEFVGVTVDILRVLVETTDTIQTNGFTGDKMFDVVQPILMKVLIAAAAGGDEGRKVYWKYNNEVSYSDGSFGNYAGTVWQVTDATHVFVVPPWLDKSRVGSVAWLDVADSAITLSKFDLGKTVRQSPTAARTITLPPVAQTSPGDRIAFFKANAAANQITIAGNAAKQINGSNTSTALATSQYAKLTIESDGAAWFIVA